jgi:mono/diheme cytochrome c family protein
MRSIHVHGLRHATAWVVAAGALITAACGGSSDKNASSAATGGPAAAVAAAPANAAVDGATIFTRCAVCHQPTGAGVPGTYPPLAGSEIANGPPDIPIRIIIKGLVGPIKVHGTTFSSAMPPYGTGAELSDAEVAAVLTFERSHWGNAGGAVTPAQVAAVRAAIASRTTPWTAPELGIKQ